MLVGRLLGSDEGTNDGFVDGMILGIDDGPALGIYEGKLDGSALEVLMIGLMMN